MDERRFSQEMLFLVIASFRGMQRNGVAVANTCSGVENVLHLGIYIEREYRARVHSSGGSRLNGTACTKR